MCKFYSLEQIVMARIASEAQRDVAIQSFFWITTPLARLVMTIYINLKLTYPH
jgi:hypothetical protein